MQCKWQRNEERDRAKREKKLSRSDGWVLSARKMKMYGKRIDEYIHLQCMEYVNGEHIYIYIWTVYALVLICWQKRSIGRAQYSRNVHIGNKGKVSRRDTQRVRAHHSHSHTHTQSTAIHNRLSLALVEQFASYRIVASCVHAFVHSFWDRGGGGRKAHNRFNSHELFHQFYRIITKTFSTQQQRQQQ